MLKNPHVHWHHLRLEARPKPKAFASPGTELSQAHRHDGVDACLIPVIMVGIAAHEAEHNAAKLILQVR